MLAKVLDDRDYALKQVTQAAWRFQRANLKDEHKAGFPPGTSPA